MSTEHPPEHPTPGYSLEYNSRETNGIFSILSLARSAALLSASRPSLSLDTQLACFTAWFVPHYNLLILSLARSAALLRASRPSLSLGTRFILKVPTRGVRYSSAGESSCLAYVAVFILLYRSHAPLDAAGGCACQCVRVCARGGRPGFNVIGSARGEVTKVAGRLHQAPSPGHWPPGGPGRARAHWQARAFQRAALAGGCGSGWQ
jgi:hypothetical protein